MTRLETVVLVFLLFGACATGLSQENAALPDAPSAVKQQEDAPPPASKRRPSSMDLDPPPPPVPSGKGARGLLIDFAQDQKEIWTSPAHLHVADGAWLVPLGGIAAGLFASDSSYSASLSQNPSTLSHYNTLSNAGIAGLAGAGAGMYLFSFPMHNDHWRETGFLSGESALNSLVTVEVLKYALGRQRPYQDHGSGGFFQGGTSFPSEHAAAAWSIAGIIAHEYPGVFPNLIAYSAASLVDFSRVHARQHFPSDVLIGSVLGYLISRSVYTRRHDPELGGGGWDPPRDFAENKVQNPNYLGSPYVPLDYWVYPLVERLMALGYVRSAYLNMRPWTRLETARIVLEAGQAIRERGDDDTVASKLYAPLAAEFDEETRTLEGVPNQAAEVESIYTRVTGISGRPQVDGYHFGQTLINDYGRPYGEGVNVISGASAYATLGTLAFYVRGEYQHAPSSPTDPFPVQQAIAAADETLAVPNGHATYNQFNLIEAYMSLTLANTQFSFGKQSLWLGPTESGSLLFSNNADSVPMFKISSVSPFKFPLLSRLLGPSQAEYFIGQLSGHDFEYNLADAVLVGPGNITPQPFIDGIKLNFRPTPNFEFGAGFTALFGGPGLPVTWGNYARSFFSHTSGTNNPAKRTTSFDFTYRVPGIRKWLTIYSDLMTVDEYSPIGSTRANVNPGIYMPQFPGLPHLELRAEGLHESLANEFAPGFVYYGQRRYRDGYTNDGNILGSWIGRAGRGGQGWLTYSFTPRNKLQLGYRHQEVSSEFIGGGRLIDYSLRGDLLAAHNAALSAYFQYEQWRFPIIDQSRRSDIVAQMQLTYFPHWRTRK